ncbi:hypothetical protein D3C80_566340 [compost metagenome]
MMRTLETKIMPGDPSMFEVADALRRYQGDSSRGQSGPGSGALSPLGSVAESRDRQLSTHCCHSRKGAPGQ